MSSSSAKYGASKDSGLDDLAAESVKESGRDDEDEELSEEERLEVKRRCLRIFDVLLLLLACAVCGGSLYASTLLLDNVSPTIMYAAAGVGGALFAANMLGLVSVWSDNVRARALLMYFTFIIVLCFGMLVIGGFAFILTKSAVAYLQGNWDTISAGLPAAQRASLTLDAEIWRTRTAMYAVGGGSLALFLLCLGAMNHAIGLMTPSRAYAVFLQSTNIAMLPIGVALIAAAIYVADTAVSAETAVAAFAIFILGTFVVVLVLIGCVGTSLQSRGVVRLFMILTFLLSFGFISFGVLALVQADLVSQLITSQWEVIRRVLPPDFAGKYDKEQFQKFIDGNLTSLGFLAVVAALVLVSQCWASMRLRAELKYESEVEQEAWQAVREGLLPKAVAENLSKGNTRSTATLMWKQQWTKGTKRSRRLIIIGCACLSFLVVAAICLAAAAVYYSTSCVKLGKYADTHVYTGANSGFWTAGRSVFVHNNYSLGATLVRVDTTQPGPFPVLSFKKAAFKEDMAAAGWPAPSNGTVRVPVAGGASVAAPAIGLEVVERSGTQVLGYDVSCQNSEVALLVPPLSRLPSAQPYLSLELLSGSTAGTGTAGVTIDMSGTQAADKPPIAFARLSSAAGPITLDSIVLGSIAMPLQGLNATSTSGELSLSRSSARCNAADVGSGVGGIRMTTDRGAVIVDGLTSSDCDVVLSGAAALTSVSNSVIRNALGGGTLSLVGARGIMAVSSSVLQALEVKGDEGSVRTTNVTASDSIKVSTTSGLVTARTLRFGSRAVLQVETESGSIDVWVSQFQGLVSIITGGSITCVTATDTSVAPNMPTGFMNTSTPCVPTLGGVDASGAETLKVVDNVEVNCESSRCPYLGQMTLTSMRGSVTLRVDRYR